MSINKLAYGKTVVDSTITVSTEKPSYEKKYLHDLSQKNFWSTLDTYITSQTILINHGTAKNIKLVFFDNTNIVSGDTLFTIQAGTTAAATDYGPTPLPKDTKSWLEIDQTYQYFLVTITKASGTNIEVGRFELFQNIYTFPKNYQIDRSSGPIEVFSDKIGRRGQVSRKFLYQTERRVWQFLNITKTQVDTMKKTIGKETEVCLYDGEELEYYYGIMNLTLPTVDRCEKRDMQLSFTESQ
jgi:hypothetical protein